MRKTAQACLLGLALSAACTPASSPGGSPTTGIDRIIDETLAYAPAAGRNAGLHRYDGQVGDYSAGGIQRRIQMLELHERELATLPVRGPDDVLDVELLRWQAAEELFELRDAKAPERDPAFYDELFSVSGYLDRDYAPFDVRYKALVQHEEAALEQVNWIYTNLKPPLGKPLVDIAIQIYGGYAEYLRKDVVKRTASGSDADMKRRFDNANEALAKEADKLVAWLKTVPTDQSHILGPKRFERLVELYAGEKMPLDEFERVGEADLAKNKAAFEALKDVAPIKVTHPLEEAKLLTDDARAFVIEHRLVSMLRDDRAEVVETPPYLRYNFAWLDAGGPFEVSTGAFFYVTPPDPKWSFAEQEAYVPPRGELRSIGVHEVYPGHFVQSGFLRRAPTKAQKLVDSSTFVEGWAHYVEQMMVDEGFGADPEGRKGQISMALQRDCRYLVALGIHAKGMSIEAATKRFVDDCHQTEPVAKQQATRGAFHPWYFAYTLGKLQILKLRAEAQQALGSSFDLHAFHDALLSHGQGPIGLVRKRVLADLGVR